MWRGNLERSPGPCPEVDGGMASKGRFILVVHSAVEGLGLTTLSRTLLAYFLVHGEMNKNFFSKSEHHWVDWAALKK